jgi:hypothetical protein
MSTCGKRREMAGRTREKRRVRTGSGERSRDLMWRLGPERAIHALCEVANMGLSAFLLGLKPRRRFLGHADLSPKTAPAPKWLSGRYREQLYGDALTALSFFAREQLY